MVAREKEHTMRVEVVDEAGTSGTAVVEEYDVEELLKTKDWFGDTLNVVMAEGEDEAITVGAAIHDLQWAINRRQQSLVENEANALGLKIRNVRD